MTRRARRTSSTRRSRTNLTRRREPRTAPSADFARALRAINHHYTDRSPISHTPIQSIAFASVTAAVAVPEPLSPRVAPLASPRSPPRPAPTSPARSSTAPPSPPRSPPRSPSRTGSSCVIARVRASESVSRLASLARASSSSSSRAPVFPSEPSRGVRQVEPAPAQRLDARHRVLDVRQRIASTHRARRRDATARREVRTR